jgi:hypothetical protein
VLAAALAAAVVLGCVGCQNAAVCLNCVQHDAGARSSSTADAARSGTGGADGGGAGAAGAAGAAGGSRTDAAISTCVSSGGPEICNGIDDDCDGKVDEDFDLQTNPLHCGQCLHVCASANAEASCEHAQCVVHGCQPGFADLAPGPECEYRCPVFPTMPEACNGIDDDCDGKVDEDLRAPANDICNHRAGTPCANVGLVCDKRGGRTTWYCAYPSAVQFDPIVPNGIIGQESLCDGLDNDCDGVADDPWPELGQPCDDGEIGACRDGGEMRCNPQDRTRTYCDLSLAPAPVPGAGPAAIELCNGIDDNCDGVIDNPDRMDPKHVVDDLQHVAHGGLDFWIYRYEASRPDATSLDEGIDGARACSNAGALPWTYVSYDAAAAACAAAGHRLCTAVEWQAACEGTGASTYPYGAAYVADACNGADHDVVPGGNVDNAVLVAGALPQCVSADAVRDLSGNVKEWTADQQGTTGAPTNLPIYVVRGGSYLSPQLGLTCQTTLAQATANTVLPSLGFRCCADAAP